MTKVIFVGNYKGGVGKTQTSFELLWGLASRGFRTLAIDADQQGNLTTQLSCGSAPQGRTLGDILVSGEPITPDDIHRRNIGNCRYIDYVVSNETLGRIERRLPDVTPKEYAIRYAISHIKSNYDFIVIDGAPSMEILGIGCMNAADYIIIPAMATKLCLEGTNQIMSMIQLVKEKEYFNPSLSILGILITMRRPTISMAIMANNIRKAYGDLVLDTEIHDSTEVQKASNDSKCIQDYDPKCRVAQEYNRAINEIIEKLNNGNN